MADDKTYTQEELKAEIDKAVEQEVTGLKNKNSELIDKLKKRDEEFKGLEKRLGELEDAKEEAERAKAEKEGDVKTALEKAEKKWAKERDELTRERDEAQARVQKHLVDGGLTEALVTSGVAKEFLPAARALLKSENKFEVNDDGVLVDGKPLKEFVSGWAQGDTGKPYIAADKNGGGGAQGANGGGEAAAGKTVTRAQWDAMDHSARASFSKDGGKVVET